MRRESYNPADLGSYARSHVHAKDIWACLRLHKAGTHSELAAIQLGAEKLGICGRLTLGTVRFGTLGIWRLTLGRVLVILLWRERDQQKTENRDCSCKLVVKINKLKKSLVSWTWTLWFCYTSLHPFGSVDEHDVSPGQHLSIYSGLNIAQLRFDWKSVCLEIQCRF